MSHNSPTVKEKLTIRIVKQGVQEYLLESEKKQMLKQ